MFSIDKELVLEQAYLGLPSNFGNICKVYPLLIPDILSLGSIYHNRLGMLLLTETDIQELIKKKTQETIPLEKLNPLEYLMQSAAQDNTFFLELHSAFFTFIKEEILLLPKISSVLVGDPKDRRLITPQNFMYFQEILKIQNNKKTKELPPPDETPGQRKMRLLREKVEEAKRKKNQKSESNNSFVFLMSVADTFGIDLEKSTLVRFNMLLERNQAREKWNYDIQLLCAGADSKSLKMTYWGDNSDTK